MTQPNNCDSPVAEYGHRTVFGLDLLIPDKEWNDIVLSAMGRASAATDVRVISSTYMSNHDHHLLLSPKREFADWLRICHQVIAEQTNKRLDRAGPVWSSRKPYFATVYSMRQALLRGAYHIGNAARAGIARKFEEHQGVVIVPRNDSYTIELERPSSFGTRSRVDKRPTVPVVGLRELVPIFHELKSRDASELARHAAAVAEAHDIVEAVSKATSGGEPTPSLARSGSTPDAPPDRMDGAESETIEFTEHPNSQSSLSPQQLEQQALDDLLRAEWDGTDTDDTDYAGILMRIVRARERQQAEERKRRGRQAAGPKTMSARNAEKLKSRVWEHLTSADCQREYRLARGPRPLPFHYDSEAERELRLRRDAAFVELYRNAWSDWLGTETDVLFPRGTMKMRNWPHVIVDTGPPELPLPIAA